MSEDYFLKPVPADQPPTQPGQPPPGNLCVLVLDPRTMKRIDALAQAMGCAPAEVILHAVTSLEGTVTRPGP